MITPFRNCYPKIPDRSRHIINAVPVPLKLAFSDKVCLHLELTFDKVCMTSYINSIYKHLS